MNEFQRPAKGWRLKRDSFTKLVVWFKDGNVRTFYSLDWPHRYARERSRSMGTDRLRKKLREWGDRTGMAQLYDNQTGQEVARFFEGHPVEPDSSATSYPSS